MVVMSDCELPPKQVAGRHPLALPSRQVEAGQALSQERGGLGMRLMFCDNFGFIYFLRFVTSFA
jgi:hypothetical protein